MGLNIILIVVLFGLVGGLVFSISRRKKKEKAEAEAAVAVQSDVALQGGYPGQKSVGTQADMKQNDAAILKDRIKKKLRESTTEGPLIDYSQYHLKVREFIFYAILAGAVFFLLGILFYESTIMGVILGLMGLFYPKFQKRKLLEKRKDQLGLQFKEAISSLSSSLAAGRSTENSFREVAIDLALLYPDPKTFIIREFQIINRRVENGETIERAIEDFARRSDVEDILNFSDVFITCKRTGGDLVEVIRRTSDVISEKIDIQQEISVVVAQKRFESKILSLMPLGMIVLMKSSAGDYMEPLYDWAQLGPLVMTGCLILLAFSYWMSQRIMNIRV